jgi:hypothetical protein
VAGGVSKGPVSGCLSAVALALAPLNPSFLRHPQIIIARARPILVARRIDSCSRPHKFLPPSMRTTQPYAPPNNDDNIEYFYDLTNIASESCAAHNINDISNHLLSFLALANLVDELRVCPDQHAQKSSKTPHSSKKYSIDHCDSPEIDSTR